MAKDGIEDEEVERYFQYLSRDTLQQSSLMRFVDFILVDEFGH
jgi:hypothetical protein